MIFPGAAQRIGLITGDIDAGGVLDGYTGVIVRAGYVGYSHLTDALHAWCGACNLRDLRDMRDLRDLFTFDPDGQLWARSVADLLIHANVAATAARAAGQPGSPRSRWPSSTPDTAVPSPKASPITRENAVRPPRTGHAWHGGSATART